jgi:hypothetical protein
MTQGPGGVDPNDWITIWQSEMAAMAVDREIHEGLAAATHAWNAALAARIDGPPGLPRPDAPPGTTPPGHAPRAGEHERPEPRRP